MQRTSASYLSEIRRQLHLEPAKEDEILEEIQTHIEDRAAELQDAGNSSDQAFARAMDEFGATRSIGQQLYAVYHQAPWQQTALAALPHLLLAVMFGLSLWDKPGMGCPAACDGYGHQRVRMADGTSHVDLPLDGLLPCDSHRVLGACHQRCGLRRVEHRHFRLPSGELPAIRRLPWVHRVFDVGR